MDKQAIADEVPIPLIERGDWVRLKQVYKPAMTQYEMEREFTHGIVVEIISRVSLSQFAGADTEVVGAWRDNDLPAERVSLHLFNPVTGLMYLANHPSEPGKPEFVDHDICELTLLHKATETWGRDIEVDISEQYNDWGITVPHFDDQAKA